jgi:hypothetical protein
MRAVPEIRPQVEKFREPWVGSQLANASAGARASVEQLEWTRVPRWRASRKSRALLHIIRRNRERDNRIFRVNESS